jgi:hypothetical protein
MGSVMSFGTRRLGESRDQLTFLGKLGWMLPCWLAAQLRLPVSLLLTFPRSGGLYLSYPGADADLVEVAEQASRILVDPIGSRPLQLVLPVSP